MGSFRTKHFDIRQDEVAFKFGTDSVILGSWSQTSLDDRNETYQILDVGTGCGILSMMMAQHYDKSFITGIEMDRPSYLTASENFKASKFNDRLQAVHVDFLKFQSLKKYDLIITNPPFFKNSLKGENPSRNKARHQDSLNLNQLLSKSMELLSEKGKILFIIPVLEEKSIQKFIEQTQIYCSRQMHISSYKESETIRLTYELCLTKCETQISKIHIYDLKKEYSEEYKSLTSEFYI